MLLIVVFFFQAEDGIRDLTVTGVQTCALPIYEAELVLEMDCDFSHDPKDVPRLVAAAEDGADVVLGSRYVRGGGVGNWGVLRRVISRGGAGHAPVPVRTPGPRPTRRLQLLPPRGA